MGPEGVIAIVAFTVLLVGAVLTIVFAAIRRSIAREASSLSDVELDSGPVKLTARYTDFQTKGIDASSAIKVFPSQLVLTSTHLHLLQRPQLYGIFARDELRRFEVKLLDTGVLQIATDDPPYASGRIEYRARVPNADTWVRALLAAGARRAAE